MRTENSCCYGVTSDHPKILRFSLFPFNRAGSRTGKRSPNHLLVDESHGTKLVLGTMNLVGAGQEIEHHNSAVCVPLYLDGYNTYDKTLGLLITDSLTSQRESSFVMLMMTMISITSSARCLVETDPFIGPSQRMMMMMNPVIGARRLTQATLELPVVGHITLMRSTSRNLTRQGSTRRL